jgi:uncharacterized caspase-like protein/uncharacterized protein YjiK
VLDPQKTGNRTNVGVATVISVQAFAATARMPSGIAIPAGAKAVVMEQSDDALLHVSLSASIARNDRVRVELTNSLKNNPSVSIFDPAEAKPENPQAEITVKSGKFKEVFGELKPIIQFENGNPLPVPDRDAAIYYLDDGSKLPLYALAVKGDDPNGAKLLVVALQKYAKQRALTKLSNPVSVLNNKVAVKVFRVEGETDANSKLKITKETEIPFDDRLIFDEGEGFRIAVENKFDKPLYIAVLEIGTDGSINNLYDKPAIEARLKPDEQLKTGVYRVHGPAGSGAFKIIVSQQPVDYSFLEQAGVIDAGKASSRSALGESLKEAAPDRGQKVLRAHAGNGSSEIKAEADTIWATIQIGFAVSSTIGTGVVQLETSTVRVWDTTNGKSIYAPETNALAANCVVYSPDGKYIAIGNADKTISLRDAKSGDPIHTLAGHSESVLALAFRPDSKILASAAADGKIILWNVNDGSQISVLDGHRGKVNSLAFNPDGHTIISGGSDRTIKFWFAKNGQNYDTLEGHTDEITSIAFSSDGKTIASASLDKTIKVWEVGADKELRTITGHKLAVSAIRFSPDGKTLASGSADNTIKLWDVVSGKELRTFTGHTRSVSAVAFSNDGKTLVSGSADGSLKLWNPQTGELVRTVSAHAFGVTSAVFSPDGKSFASTSLTGDLAAPRLYVLSVGINDYQMLPKLRFAVNDAQEFGSTLEQVGREKFESIRKTLLIDKDATKSSVTNAFENLLAEARPQDTLVFFFAGQAGIGGPQSDLFSFACADSKDLTDSISAIQLKQWSQKIPAKKQLFILDTNQSAKAIKTFVLPAEQDKSPDEKKSDKNHAISPGAKLVSLDVKDSGSSETAVMIMGIDGEEYDSIELEHGVFTYALLQGLTGRADAGLGDGKITAKGLEAFVYRSLERIREKQKVKSKIDIRPASYAIGGDIALGTSQAQIEGAVMRGTESLLDAQEVQLRSIAESKRYALLIATDNYKDKSGWKKLSNPVFDADTIAKILVKDYGFQVKLVPDGNVNDILTALNEYKAKTFGPNDQVFVFFSGHGAYSEGVVDGLIIATDSIANDRFGRTAIHHTEIKNILESIDCPNVLLVLDSCFSGTFAGEEVGVKKGNPYDTVADAEYYRRLAGEREKPVKMFLTSGGKEYVSDGKPGSHSPFARLLIQALTGPANKHGAVTFDMISNAVIETQSATPHWGYLGPQAKGKQFLFIRTKKAGSGQ